MSGETGDTDDLVERAIEDVANRLIFSLPDAAVGIINRHDYTTFKSIARDLVHAAGIPDIGKSLTSLRAERAQIDTERANWKRWTTEAESSLAAEKLRVAELEARLEIDHCYRFGDGDELVREEIPAAERASFPDGISARDATIQLLEESKAALEQRVAALVGLLRRYQDGQAE